MLSNRQNQILKMIVEYYVKQAKPVSSKQICKKLKCSSATVRSEMANLENEGLLEKTHTSSGRIPSEEGYRYYVDHLLEPKKMNGEDMLKLQIIFHNQSLDLSDCIKKSLQVVSDMTSYTAVVLGTASHENLLKEVSVVPLSDSQVIVIIVTDKGKVEHKTLNLDGVNVADVKKTVDLINKLVVGTPIDEVSAKLEFEVKPIIGNYVFQHEKLYDAIYNVFNDFVNPDINVVGRTKFLEQPEFSDVTKIKNLFSKLDNDDLIREIKHDNSNNIEVYIGSENSIDEDVTVIKTNFKSSSMDGTIAIIGPKRMEYDRVMSMLEYIKENIEDDASS